jgi:hypothetical protein
MKSNLPDRGLVRQYLLGRLDSKKELEDQLSNDILFNDELSEVVESIEEEIIEDYVDGTLDFADKDAVDEYFLRPPERKEKLRFARLLRDHFEERHDLVEAGHHALPSTDTNVIQERIDYRSAIPWRSYFRSYGQFAALILLSVGSLIYISSVRKNQARLESQLAQEREHAASLVTEAQLLESPLLALTLVSDRSRADGTRIPYIEIRPSTQRILVEIALQGRSPGPYDVHLETNAENGPIWSALLLPLISASGDARLVFDLPVQRIKSDVYSFVVSSAVPGSGRPKHYDFRVKLTR